MPRRVKHPCAAEGCTRNVDYSMLMCHEHWVKVTPLTQRRVYRAWNGGDTTDDYEAARAKAVEEAVEEAA